MKTVDEFIEKMVRIEFIEQSNCFGHYPFQMCVETKEDHFEINALALGGDVASCYERFAYYIKNEAKRIYLSLDFPQGDDIKNDFVAIFSYEDMHIKLYAIPYNVSDGQRFEIIKESKLLDKIKAEFESFL